MYQKKGWELEMRSWLRSQGAEGKGDPVIVCNECFS